MRRRALLATVATAVTAGCTSESVPSGPRTPPGGDDARSEPPGSDSGDGRPPGLFLLEWDYVEGADGTLLVEAVVGNDADEERNGTVVAEVSGPDRTVEVTESVTVAPDETVDVRLPTDLEYEGFASDGQLSLDIRTE